MLAPINARWLDGLDGVGNPIKMRESFVVLGYGYLEILFLRLQGRKTEVSTDFPPRLGGLPFETRLRDYDKST